MKAFLRHSLLLLTTLFALSSVVNAANMTLMQNMAPQGSETQGKCENCGVNESLVNSSCSINCPVPMGGPGANLDVALPRLPGIYTPFLQQAFVSRGAAPELHPPRLLS